jgi:hypothetical protein
MALIDDSVRARLAALAPAPKPWSQFFSADAFNKPLKLETASARAGANVRTYASNYGALSLVCVAFATFTSPLLALAAWAGVAAGGAYHLDIKGASKVADKRTAYGVLALYAILLLSLTNLVELLAFGLGFGAVACVLHALLHDPPETFNEI